MIYLPNLFLIQVHRNIYVFHTGIIQIMAERMPASNSAIGPIRLTTTRFFSAIP